MQPYEKEKKSFPFWTILVLIICAGIWFGGFWLFKQQTGMYEAYQKETQRVLSLSDTYVPGVMVDGVDLGGMTEEQARALFSERQNKTAGDFALVIQYGDRKWRMTSSEIPMIFDADMILERAFLPGHVGTLEERNRSMDEAANGAYTFETSYVYDLTKIASFVEIIGDAIDIEPVDATLDAFDADTQQFTMKEGTTGLRADREKLMSDILQVLENDLQDEVIWVSSGTIEPELHAADLYPHFDKMSTFTTETTKDRDRNKNIEISAAALNGKVVYPGESLSFNNTTGKRTYEKGYREAHAIVGGVLVDDTGGGVCQTSSTLFNAVVRADLEIVKRYAHSWPSIYVNRGEDATVNWPNRDFVFKNTSPYPIFIRAWYDKYQVTVEIYGLIPDGFARIDLESETVKTIKPSDDVLYTLDESLPLGTRQQGHSKRTGYIVDTYKVYYDAEGNVINRIKLWTTNYPATQQEIVYH